MSLVEPFGDRAALVTCVDRQDRMATAAVLAERVPEWSIRQAARSVLVVADRPEPTIVAAVTAALSLPHPSTVDAVAPVVVIAVEYDGPDLAATAAGLSVSVDGLVQAHAAQPWVVDAMGFAPGFGYLVPDGAVTLDWSVLSRRDTPRERVPEGSVAVAAGMSAVYPSEMPGGWNLLGRTSARLFDAGNAVQPALLIPGARVRFAAVRG